MTEDKNVDVIETFVMFAVDITVNVKVRKTTTYGSSEPEYKLAEVGGVVIPDGLDWSTKDNIIKNIEEEAFGAVKKHESERNADRRLLKNGKTNISVVNRYVDSVCRGDSYLFCISRTRIKI